MRLLAWRLLGLVVVLIMLILIIITLTGWKNLQDIYRFLLLVGESVVLFFGLGILASTNTDTLD